MNLPPGVAAGSYTIKPPLIKRSGLTSKERGGVGKELSEGYALNFAVGCTFGCTFCYVDDIHKRFGAKRVGDIVQQPWGFYFAVPSNMEEAMAKTHWKTWAGREVMLSSTHDAFLPQLHDWTREILEVALPEGVRFCIQTRSPLVEQDFDILVEYSSQVRLQVSIATMDPAFARVIEPRVVPPARRAEILDKAKAAGLSTGIIIAPVFPDVPARPSFSKDLVDIAKVISGSKPDHIYGECIHERGVNLSYLEQPVGRLELGAAFDSAAEVAFHSALELCGMKGIWWPDFK